ncbi:MAG: MBL fold metallo-hydrolase [Treponema sp.]|nr:MBL fold metallo-hydrolase [Treponema sp.]
MSDKKIIQLVVGPLATNCWIYSAEDCTAIIDPGFDPEVIIAALEKLMVSFSIGQRMSPIYILLTHGHIDHIGAIPAIMEAFPGQIQIAIHGLDKDYIGPTGYETQKVNLKVAFGDTAFLDRIWKGMPAPDILLEEGSIIGSSLHVIHLPGHSPGSIAYWDKEEGVLFSGDVLFAGSRGRTNLPLANEDDMLKSLDRLYAMDGNIKVCPGHGNSTTIKQEIK